MTDVMAVRNEYRMDQWAGIIEERRESGLSIREFCRQRELREGAYYYWLRKLRSTITENARPTFVELSETDRGRTEEAVSEDILRIEYRGIKVELPDSANMNGVPELLSAIKRL